MDYIAELIERYPELSVCREEIERACGLWIEVYEKRKKLLVCGNGGSAADSDHIVGELMKGFHLPRGLTGETAERLGEYAPHLQMPLRAISLTGHPALTTAFLNDVEPDMIFAQQVFGYGDLGDLLVGISTSGNSRDVVHAAEVAGRMGLRTMGLTGQSGGRLADLCDLCIRVPAEETAKIQEYHLPIYHALCAETEKHFFS